MIWEFYQESLNQGISHRMLHPAVHTDSTSKQVYQILICFDKIYFEMTDMEKKATQFGCPTKKEKASRLCGHGNAYTGGFFKCIWRCTFILFLLNVLQS